MKTCTACLQEKETDCFYFDKATDTLKSTCKPCTVKFNVLARSYRKKGEKLTMPQFRRMLKHET
jgi:hypothetical protein